MHWSTRFEVLICANVFDRIGDRGKPTAKFGTDLYNNPTRSTFALEKIPQTKRNLSLGLVSTALKIQNMKK